ncbi:hypothetical protein L6452_36338 [Arctium lappa]|uniref:Uncharacterized protein n=1 Tax=Arctium lappa TaxID=4217 RepID=A0ACB8Y9I6_ARCLA|nr:hypothetical protein L6452_36338 [Arctium lappa]
MMLSFDRSAAREFVWCSCNCYLLERQSLKVVLRKFDFSSKRGRVFSLFVALCFQPMQNHTSKNQVNDLVEEEALPSQSQNTRTSVFERLSFATAVGKAQTTTHWRIGKPMCEVSSSEGRGAQVTVSMEGEVSKTLSPKEFVPGDVGVIPEGKGGDVLENDMGFMEGQNIGEILSANLGAVLEGLSGNGIISDKGKNE